MRSHVHVSPNTDYDFPDQRLQAVTRRGIILDHNMLGFRTVCCASAVQSHGTALTYRQWHAPQELAHWTKAFDHEDLGA